MRSISVCPRATSPAITRLAEARKSVAITVATVQRRHTGHDRGISIDPDIRSQPDQLDRVHEAVFENRFANHGRTVRDAIDRHELRLHIGRESGIRSRSQTDRFQALRRLETDRIIGTVDHAPASRSFSTTESSQAAEVRASVTSPPLAAAAHRKVPVSMRSGMTE